MTPHNSASLGDFAKTVLMPGDPLRAKFIVDNFLTDVRQVTSVRNVLGFTGLYKGVPVSVMASGMGMPSIAIYSYELFTEYGVENIMRIGSAGSYVGSLNVNDVVLAKECHSESSFIHQMDGGDSHVTYPSESLNEAIKSKAEAMRIDLKTAVVHSTDAFYTMPSKGDWKAIASLNNADCCEMEGFALFHVAKTLGKNAACLLTISDSFVTHLELTAEERQNSFRTMMTLALETAITL